MSDRQAFLRMICENPDDDGPRLVYADWLEEQGDPYGEFIRLQIERARLPPTDQEGRQRLTKRADDLYSAHREAWMGALPRLSGITWGFFDRGMIEMAEIQGAEAFVKHAEAIFAAAPIRQLWLNELGEAGARTVAQSPHLGRIAVLKASECALGDAGIEALATSPHVRGLTHLLVSGNGISAVGARALASSQSLGNLMVLFLTNNTIGDEGAQELARSRGLQKVTEIYAASNNIHEAGTAALRRRWGERVFV